MRGSRYCLAVLSCSLGLATITGAQQLSPPLGESASPVQSASRPGEDDSLASKVTVRGETMANGTYRLSFHYEPGRGVRETLGEGGLEHLSFLVYSEPSRSLLALFFCGGDEAEAARRGAEIGALTTVGLPWDGALRATTYLPRLPESDKTVSVELVALGRRAKLPETEELSGVSFATTSSFREMSLLESGEPEG